MTETFAKFTSPVLSDFQVVEARRKPPVIRCRIKTVVEGPHKLILTNPKMILTPNMPPSEIAKKISGKWGRLIILKHTQDSIHYELDFESAAGGVHKFGVRVSECIIEQDA